MKEIYIGTGNPAKFETTKEYIDQLGLDIVVEMVPEVFDVIEDGKDLKENSLLKAKAYEGKFDVPVLTNDSAIFFDRDIEEIQDPVKVKRNALKGMDEKDLSKEEIGKMMFDYYKELARKYGGSIDVEMRGSYTLMMPNGEYFQDENIRKYRLTDRDLEEFNTHFPLKSLLVSARTNKFRDDMSKE